MLLWTGISMACCWADCPSQLQQECATPQTALAHWELFISSALVHTCSLNLSHQQQVSVITPSDSTAIHKMCWRCTQLMWIYETCLSIQATLTVLRKNNRELFSPPGLQTGIRVNRLELVLADVKVITASQENTSKLFQTEDLDVSSSFISKSFVFWDVSPLKSNLFWHSTWYFSQAW